MSVNVFGNVAEIMVDAWEMSPALSVLLKPHIPSDVDFGKAVAKRVGRFAECMSAPGAHCMVLPADPDRIFKRTKRYARLLLDADIIRFDKLEQLQLRRGAEDLVRGECLSALVNAFADMMIADVGAMWSALEPPLGASVTYNSALASPRPKAALRFNGPPIKILPHQFDGGPAFAAYDHNSHSIMLRFASYYFCTPLDQETHNERP